ncbi:hypothetical protein [Geodermatophilus sp. Leaf369]|uniref:hypothetical protein n=1 Tax=Geodermatophilus sp. Leaf369 TaxID=1736354 RepID=UPI0012FCB859|nr:hypothetical protein [Geodermatophilus sp. Leaf369]
MNSAEAAPSLFLAGTRGGVDCPPLPPLTREAIQEAARSSIPIGKRIEAIAQEIDELVISEKISVLWASHLMSLLEIARRLAVEGLSEEANEIIRVELLGSLLDSNIPVDSRTPRKDFLQDQMARALFLMCQTASSGALQSLFEFTVSSFNDLRSRLINESFNYEVWCDNLRRLFVACYHVNTTFLVHMLEDEFSQRDFVALENSPIESMINPVRSMRRTLLMPIFTLKDRRRLHQGTIVIEETFCWIAVIKNSQVDTETGTSSWQRTIIPSRRTVDHIVAQIIERAQTDPIAARLYAREQFRMRYSLPRYAFDSVEATIRQLK